MATHSETDRDRIDGEDERLSLADFFGCLLKVIRFLKLYPNDHPFISRSLDELHGLWDFIRSSQGEFAFESRTGSIFAGGSEVAHAPRALRPLKRMLEDKSVDGLAIDHSTEFEEFRDLANLLARPREEVVEKNRIKPVHLVGLKGIRLSIGRRPTPADGAALAPPSLPARRPGLSGLLLRALSRPFDPDAVTDDPITRHILDRTPIPADELDVVQWLEHRPDDLARAVTVAVNRLLMGSENPAAEDLLSAFAHTLEPLVAARLDAEPGGFGSMEDTVHAVMARFDPGFVRRMLPDGPGGRPVIAPLLRRFAASLKLRVLEGTLLDEGLDEGGFRHMLEAVCIDEEEEIDLLSRLAKAVARDERFKGCFTRVARILRPGPGVRQRRNTVLVLDPDSESNRQIQSDLEPSGIELHLLGEGERLLGEIQRIQPDVVVVEPKLRGVQGLHLISQLRRAGGSGDPVPLVVFTETAAFEHEFEIQTYPGCRFVSKVDGTRRLREVVEEILKQRGRSEDSRRPLAAVDLRPSREVANRHFFLPRFEILTYHAPAESGSTTFFDVVPVSETQTCILMADGFHVSPDERTSAGIREGLRCLMAAGTDPRLLLRDLNSLFWKHLGGRPLIAAQALLLDSLHGTVTACLAGGDKPLKISALGDTDRIALPSGIVLGFSRGVAFESTLKEMLLPVGGNEALLVYSTGMIDALGSGDPKRAFAAIRRETAIAYHDNRAASSPLPGVVQRLSARLHASEGEARDRAAIWIRCLPTSHVQKSTIAEIPAPSRQGRGSRA